MSRPRYELGLGAEFMSRFNRFPGARRALDPPAVSGTALGRPGCRSDEGNVWDSASKPFAEFVADTRRGGSLGQESRQRNRTLVIWIPGC